MSGVRGGWCVGRGGRVRFIKVATRIAPPDQAGLARSRPRGGRSSFRRRAAHQARIGPCGAPSVGIRRAGNRPMSTNWRHAASGRARHLRAQCSTFPGMADFSARWRPCVRPDVPRCIRTAFPASKRDSLGSLSRHGSLGKTYNATDVTRDAHSTVSELCPVLLPCDPVTAL